MALVCKSICQRLKVPRKPKDGNHYKDGKRRCNFCEAFYLIDGIRCPCCGGKLRFHTRYGPGKDKYEIARNRRIE